MQQPVQQSLDEFLDSLPNQPEVDCSEVDVQQIEEAGLSIYNSLQESITNFNLMDAQYNLESMYTQAKKIGVDVGDIVEYGFEEATAGSESTCSAKYCLDRKKFKDFDDMMERANLFGQRLKDSSIYAYRRARCSPEFEKTVTPKVQWIWQLFPLNILFYNPLTFWLTIPVDILSAICCWPLWIPFQLLVVMPWNTTIGVIIAAALVVLLIGAVILAVFISIGLGVLAFAWIGVQGLVALIISFFGFLVLFFTTGGFAVGGVVVFGPLAFFFTVIGAFISTLGF